MAVITLPSALRIATATWGLMRKDVAFSSAFGSQSVAVSAPVWTASLVIDTQLDYQAGEWQALLLKLRGQTNQLALHNVGRPAPLGTMRGAMVCFNATAGASTMVVGATSAQGNKTLKTGDFLGFGTGTAQQIVMVVADATSDANGDVTIVFEPPLRQSYANGTAVVWDKPAALFRATQKDFSWQRQSVFVSGMTLDLVEDVRP
jgi:hypothetical protein